MTEKKKQFTLIELLVVIAIIAILASMLLPALNQARARAKSITCVSNLKQTGFSQLAYADDFDGLLVVHTWHGGIDKGWSRILWDLKYIDGKSMFCPSTKNKEGDISIWQSHTYSMHHGKWGGDAWYDPRKNLFGDWKFDKGDSIGFYYAQSRVKAPGIYPLFTDSVFFTGDNIGHNFCKFAPCSTINNAATSLHHNNNANLAYADGHVETKNETELRADGFTKFSKGIL